MLHGGKKNHFACLQFDLFSISPLELYVFPYLNWYLFTTGRILGVLHTYEDNIQQRLDWPKKNHALKRKEFGLIHTKCRSCFISSFWKKEWHLVQRKECVHGNAISKQMLLADRKRYPFFCPKDPSLTDRLVVHTRLEFLEAFGFKLFVIPSTCPHHSIYTCPQKFVYDNYVPYTLPKHCSSDLYNFLIEFAVPCSRLLFFGLVIRISNDQTT